MRKLLLLSIALGCLPACKETDSPPRANEPAAQDALQRRTRTMDEGSRTPGDDNAQEPAAAFN